METSRQWKLGNAKQAGSFEREGSSECWKIRNTRNRKSQGAEEIREQSRAKNQGREGECWNIGNIQKQGSLLQIARNYGKLKRFQISEHGSNCKWIKIMQLHSLINIYFLLLNIYYVQKKVQKKTMSCRRASTFKRKRAAQISYSSSTIHFISSGSNFINK